MTDRHETLYLDPRSVYDAALVGHTTDCQDHWPGRETGVRVAVYSVDKCVEAVMRWLAVGRVDAEEYVSFNTMGVWQGPATPTFREFTPQNA